MLSMRVSTRRDEFDNERRANHVFPRFLRRLTQAHKTARGQGEAGRISPAIFAEISGLGFESSRVWLLRGLRISSTCFCFVSFDLLSPLGGEFFFSRGVVEVRQGFGGLSDETV